MLTGSEKAVLFLLSLDEEVARPIVGELSQEELKKLRAIASSMREVPAGALEEAYREFLSRTERHVAVPRGGLPYLRRLSAGAFGEDRAREVFEDGITSPFTRLESAPSDAVAMLLAKEPPQLAAAILARIEPEAAARILMTMPQEQQVAVIQSVSRLKELPAKVLDDAAMALVNDLPTSDAQTTVSVDGVAMAAAMLNAVGPSAGEILSELEVVDKPRADDVRMAMFTFNDLARCDARAMREILRGVPSERLVVALKGSEQPVMDAIFLGLSQRASELIRDDLELLGKVKRSDVELARREVVEVALRLEAEGKIDLGREQE
jgi:flagellar motor switch protein FliG